MLTYLGNICTQPRSQSPVTSTILAQYSTYPSMDVKGVDSGGQGQSQHAHVPYSTKLSSVRLSLLAFLLSGMAHAIERVLSSQTAMAPNDNYVFARDLLDNSRFVFIFNTAVVLARGT